MSGLEANAADSFLRRERRLMALAEATADYRGGRYWSTAAVQSAPIASWRGRGILVGQTTSSSHFRAAGTIVVPDCPVAQLR
jgi:hypothetical protein